MIEEEWCKRFVAHMIERAGFSQFSDGLSVRYYAEITAPTYYEMEFYRDEGPEACAEADISYWGEE